jgi:hypothetical protein
MQEKNVDMNEEYRNEDGGKLRWVRPELRKLEAGEAESQRATVNDGSGQQAS